MRIVVTFIDDCVAYIEMYEESNLVSRQTVKPVHAMVWMRKQEKCWTWGYDENGHEIAESE